MPYRVAALAALACLAGCGGTNGAQSNTALAGNSAQTNNALPGNSAGSATGIQAPPQAELDAALRTITDPQLAAQVAPDGNYEAAECVVHIGQFDPAPAGQEQALTRASDAWRASLVRELGETGAAQMIGSSVNMLQPTPAPLRQAAVAWCVANAPPAAG